MTEAELKVLFRLLRGYWPGEWDETRYAVWGEAFTGLTFDTAVAAMKELGRTEDFPTVARFLRIAGGVRPAGVISEGDRRFLPGTGWITEPAELETGGAVVHIDEARRALKRPS